MTTKADIVAGAYTQLRISGITVDPTSDDNTLALERLENMAAMFYGGNICTGYTFEDDPDLSSNHNMKRRFWLSYQVMLAANLLSDFGKDATPSLASKIKIASSFLNSQTAEVPEVQYPARQPVGSGNTFRNTHRRFFSPTTEPPVSCATKKLAIDDINDYVEHFDAYLDMVAGETISSFTIDSDTGLVVVSSSSTDEDVAYQIRADGGANSDSQALYQVVIVVTTSTGRKTTRLINFSLTTVEITEV